MSGIAGEIAFHGLWAEARAVETMLGAMAAWAPAGHGVCDWGWTAVGHRRLAGAGQAAPGTPLVLDEGSGLCVVFDGSLDIRGGLVRDLAGDPAAGPAADAGLVLAAYRRWGGHFVEHLAGMFALAVVDAPRQRAVLARGRRGGTTLYLGSLPGRVRFASTLPSLLAAGGVDTTIDRAALRHYLVHGSIVPAPRTILSGVDKLPAAAAHVLEARGRPVDLAPVQSGQAGGEKPDGWVSDWERALHEELRIAAGRWWGPGRPGGLDGEGFAAVDRAAQRWLRRHGVG